MTHVVSHHALAPTSLTAFRDTLPAFISAHVCTAALIPPCLPPDSCRAECTQLYSYPQIGRAMIAMLQSWTR